LSDDGEFPDYAEVWVEANRSRARILTRYFSTAGAAFFRRWIHGGRNAADRIKPGPLSGPTEVAIEEGPFAQAANDNGQGFTKGSAMARIRGDHLYRFDGQ
jgi:hypothetical protein